VGLLSGTTSDICTTGRDVLYSKMGVVPVGRPDFNGDFPVFAVV
jgi:hypothetical protein